MSKCDSLVFSLSSANELAREPKQLRTKLAQESGRGQTGAALNSALTAFLLLVGIIVFGGVLAHPLIIAKKEVGEAKFRKSLRAECVQVLHYAPKRDPLPSAT